MTNLLISGGPNRLSGARAIVTGAARGIGRAVALRLVSEGASVAAVDRDFDAVEVVVEELRQNGASQALGLRADVRNTDDVVEAMSSAASAFGGLDILVNNAGVARDARLSDLTDDDWDIVLDTDLRGYFLCARAVLSYLRESGRGRIVNISSRAHLGNPGQANYSAAKAGVIGLTRALSLELGQDHITVNAVAPGMIDTEFVRSHPKADKIIASAVKGTPLGRLGTPEDVAALVAFLASSDASFISGEVIHVSGGRH